MKKIVTIAATGLVLSACNPAAGPEGSNNSNREHKATFAITSQNAEALTGEALSRSDTVDDFDDEGPIGFSATRQLSRVVNTQQMQCDSGSYTITTDDNDIGQGSAAPVTGEIEILFSFDSCAIANVTTDGAISTILGWSGYDDVTDDFDSVYVDVTFDAYATSGAQNSYLDGTIETEATMAEAEIEWDVWEESELTNQQMIHSFTTTPLVIQEGSDYPISGAWRVEGAEGTFMTAEVVANGIEWSANGEQAELATWAEIEAGF